MILIGFKSLLPRTWLQRIESVLPAQFSALLPGGDTDNAPRAKRKLIRVEDVLVSLLLLRLLPIAAKAPPDTWERKTMALSKALHSQFGRQVAAIATSVPPVVEGLSGQSARDLSVRLFSAWMMECLEVLASVLGRFDGAGVRLEGESRLQDALAAGHGAVLWCETCFSSSLLMKAAVGSAGFQVHHLSRPGHNFSNTRYGIRVLNMLVRKAESAHLAERVMVDEGTQVPVSRRILELLKQNKVVSLTVSKLGSQVVEVPALGGVLRVATGAPHFALRSGAPLLPVFSYREGDEYVVQIGEPIAVAGPTRDGACEAAVGEFTNRLDEFVHAHPLDWKGWVPGGTYVHQG